MPPAAGELTACVDLRDAFQAGLFEGRLEIRWIVFASHRQGQRAVTEVRGIRGGLGEAVRGCQDDPRAPLGRAQLLERGQALGIPLGVGQFALEFLVRRIGEGEGGLVPPSQFLREPFPMARGAAQEPEPSVRLTAGVPVGQEGHYQIVGGGFHRGENGGFLRAPARQQIVEGAVVPGEIQEIRRGIDRTSR